MKLKDLAVIRFLLMGGINTLITILIYQLALIYTDPSASYTLAWIAGLIFVAACYPSVVFEKENSGSNTAKTLGVYLTMFLLGLGLTYFLELAGIAEQFIIFLVIAVTTLLNFIVMKKVIT